MGKRVERTEELGEEHCEMLSSEHGCSSTHELIARDQASQNSSLGVPEGF